jgi:hypothetical protein
MLENRTGGRIVYGTTYSMSDPNVEEAVPCRHLLKLAFDRCRPIGRRQILQRVLIEQRVPFAELVGKTKVSIGRGHRSPNMFRMPAYDPVAIAVMGFGICLAAALAFGL